MSARFQAIVLSAGACVLVLAASSGALGSLHQDETEPAPRIWQPISVEFEGGTVRDYVAKIRRAGENINIMVDDAAGALLLPAVELQNVMLQDALLILEDMQSEDQSLLISVDTFQTGPIEISAPVHRIVARVHSTPQPPSETSVWTVVSLLANEVNAEDILSAIETAMGLQEDLGAPEIRFHEQTGLIIARAHPQQLQAIDDVIHRLQDGLAFDRELATGRSELDELRRELERLRIENRELKSNDDGQ